LLCPLALSCLLLHLFIKAIWDFVRNGSRSVFAIPTLSVMAAAGCFPVCSVSVGAIPAPSLWEVRVVVEYG